MNSNLRTVILVMICITSSVSSFSQIINIDKSDTAAYENKAVWNGNISLGLEVDKQKTTLFDASNFLDVSLQKYHELFVLSASSRFTYNGPNDFLNAGYVHLRWRHNYKDKWHPESFVQYQWDNARGIVRRYLGGENIRYNLFRSNTWEMSFATGVMYEDEIWNYIAVDSSKIPVNNPDVHRSHFKSNSYIKWDGKVSANSTFSFIVFYQALFDHFFKPRIATSINYDVDISKKFTLDVKLSSLYDAAPVVPIINFYYNFSYGLVYKFGK